MFHLPSGVSHVHLYSAPIGMRWGEKKLTQICRDEIGIDPTSGDVFLFHNRAKDQIRLFFLDSDGCQMLTKFMPKNAFLLPVVEGGERAMEIPVSMLATLFKQ
jgi:transposase